MWTRISLLICIGLPLLIHPQSTLAAPCNGKNPNCGGGGSADQTSPGLVEGTSNSTNSSSTNNAGGVSYDWSWFSNFTNSSSSIQCSTSNLSTLIICMNFNTNSTGNTVGSAYNFSCRTASSWTAMLGVMQTALSCGAMGSQVVIIKGTQCSLLSCGLENNTCSCGYSFLSDVGWMASKNSTDHSPTAVPTAENPTSSPSGTKALVGGVTAAAVVAVVGTMAGASIYFFQRRKPSHMHVSSNPTSKTASDVDLAAGETLQNKKQGKNMPPEGKDMESLLEALSTSSKSLKLSHLKDNTNDVALDNLDVSNRSSSSSFSQGIFERKKELSPIAEEPDNAAQNSLQNKI